MNVPHFYLLDKRWKNQIKDRTETIGEYANFACAIAQLLSWQTGGIIFPSDVDSFLGVKKGFTSDKVYWNKILDFAKDNDIDWNHVEFEDLNGRPINSVTWKEDMLPLLIVKKLSGKKHCVLLLNSIGGIIDPARASDELLLVQTQGYTCERLVWFYKKQKGVLTFVEIKRYLKSLGFDPGDLNDVIDFDARLAIKEYQKVRGLQVTGTCDDEFRNLLKVEYEKK